MKCTWIHVTVVVLVGILFLHGCNRDTGDDSNPLAADALADSAGRTSLMFRFLPPSGTGESPAQASIRAQGITPPTVDITLRLVNSGLVASPVTILTRTVTATASGTGYSANASFSELPLKTVIGDVTINGGTLFGATRFRGAMDLASGPANVLDLAASGTRALPDLKARVLDLLIADAAAFASFTGLLVAQIDASFAQQGIASGSSVDQAFTALTGKPVARVPALISRSPGVGETSVATSTSVVAVFDTAIASSSLSSTTFSVAAGGTAVSGTLAVSSGSQTVTFTPGSPLVCATPFTVTISRDLMGVGGATLAADITWSFTTAVAPVVGGSAQELIISEISTSIGFTNDSRWIEIYNNSNAAIDLAGYSLKTKAFNTSNTSVPDMTFQLPSLTIASGAYAVVRVKAFSSYLDGPRLVHLAGPAGEWPYWWTDGYVDLIRKSDGLTVDFVSFGNNTTTSGLASAWTGGNSAALPSVRGKSIVRSRTLADTNTSADWTLHSWPTPGGPNDVANPDDTDADLDGIPDGCETVGTTFGGLPLAAWGAQAGRKDVFIHIDHMASTSLGIVPKSEALDKVVAAFSAKGWAVHFDVGTLIEKYNLDGRSHEVPLATYMWLGTQAGSADIYQYKAQYLDLSKQQIFHYCVFANRQNGSTSTGRGERPGNDFIITLGGVNFTNNSGGYFTQADLGNYLINEQASTLMHEFGHNLGLQHGGNDDRNYKPNYLSNMNYLYSSYGLPTVSDSRAGDRYYFRKWVESGFSLSNPWFLAYIKQPDGSYGSKAMHNHPYSSDFILDFSSGQGSPLSEANLVESAGFGRSGSAGIDWDGDGTANQTLTNYDINPADTESGSNSSSDSLADSNDWGAVAIYFATRDNIFFSRRSGVNTSRRFSFQGDDREPVEDCRRLALHGNNPPCCHSDAH